jgi:hypothetical protein
MLKALSDLYRPDPRHMPGSALDAAIGVRIEDLHAMMLPLELYESVPAEVRLQFDTARHAFIYSWFCYDLATLAEQYAYGALENGLRLRAEAEDALPKRQGLVALLKSACERGWLVRGEYDVPGMPNLLDTISLMRNHVSHGRPQLLPQLSVEAMRLCMEILNTLFLEEA